MPARSALWLTKRSNCLLLMSSRSLSETPPSAVATGAAALAGSTAGIVAVCLGSSLEIGAACLAGASMSLAVSGGGNDVSGTGTAVRTDVSVCCATAAWLDRASTSASAVEANRRSNRRLFTAGSPKLSRGAYAPFIESSLTDSAQRVTYFPIAPPEQAATVAILHGYTKAAIQRDSSASSRR